MALGLNNILRRSKTGSFLKHQKIAITLWMSGCKLSILV